MQEVISDTKEDIQKLNSADPTVRREVVEKYYSGELPDELAQVLCSKIYDNDKGVRDSIGFALTISNNSNIAEYLVPSISSEDISVRNLAGEILLKRGISSIKALLHYLENNNDDDKKFIIDILGLIGDPSSAEDIIKVLRETENDNVILACIEALGNIKSAEALNVIIRFYDKNELFRPTIMEYIGKIGDQNSLNFIMEKYAVADELTKFSILEILGRIGTEETFYFLISELRTIKAPLTWAAIASLKNLKELLGLDIPYDEFTRNAVLNTLHNADIEYQREASSLLTFFKDRDIFAASFQVFGYDAIIDENIRNNFVLNKKMFFSEITNFLKPNTTNLRSLLEFVKEMVEMDFEDIKQLSQLELRNFCSSLSDLLSHPDEEVRRISMELIFSLDESTGLIFTDLLSTDSNVWNRMKLIDLLETIYNEDANKALINLMNDEEEMVKERATNVLNQRRILN
jgi:HEAT repeat protein